MWLFCGLCGLLKRTEEGKKKKEREQYKKEKVAQVLVRVSKIVKTHNNTIKKTRGCVHQKRRRENVSTKILFRTKKFSH